MPYFKWALHKYPHSFNFAITHCFYPAFWALILNCIPFLLLRQYLLFNYFENLPGVNQTRRKLLSLQDPSLCVPMVFLSHWGSLDFYFCIHDPYDKCHLNDNKKGKNKWNTILKKHFKGISKAQATLFLFFFFYVIPELTVLDLPACYFRPLSHVASLNKWTKTQKCLYSVGWLWKIHCI